MESTDWEFLKQELEGILFEFKEQYPYSLKSKLGKNETLRKTADSKLDDLIRDAQRCIKKHPETLTLFFDGESEEKYSELERHDYFIDLIMEYITAIDEKIKFF